MKKKTFTVLKVPITHEILCILAGKAHSHLRLDWSHGTMLYNLGDRIQFPNLRCCLPAGEERMNGSKALHMEVKGQNVFRNMNLFHQF